MKKGIIKSLVLICTFAISLVIFGNFTNQNSINLTTEMRAATYPVLSVYYKDYLVGELHGYREKMDMTTMRDCVVPIQKDRAIAVDIRTFGRNVDQIRYEIRSLDGERLIAERVCEDVTTDGETIHMDLTLENLLEESEEYQLLFILASGDDTMYYYTRLMQDPDTHMDDYLDFVNQFHADSMKKENAENLSIYLEPDASAENNNLNKVTINSSLQEVLWGEFECSQMGEAVLTIAELNASYAVMTLDYVLTATGAGGELEYYNAQEYYRVSYNEEGKRCYLHNFERQVNQIFRADGENFSKNYIRLGIRDPKVEYKKSDNGRITCFVQQGELWGYNEENGTLYRIFSFRGYEGMDIRENYGAHDIRILSIREGGSVDFAVYGYMNRGVHEGQVGVSICHFDSTAATVEEVLFIRSDKSYDRLKTDMGDVLYENAEGILYCMLQGCIYRINIATGSVQTLAEGLSSESYCVSLDHHLLVWQQDHEQSKDLTVVDLEKECTSIIKSENNQRLYPIGFLADDFVYGISNAEVQKLKNGVSPMNRVVIYNVTNGENLKQYEKDNYYITGVSIEDYVITMQRIKRLGDEYIPAEPDTILNHAGEDILDDNICREYDDIKQMQMKIRLNEEATHTAANVVTSKEVLLEEIAELVLAPQEPWEGYYTYAKGRCQSFHSDLSDAIAVADEQMGVVVDRMQKAVWKRAKKLVCMPLELPEGFDEKEISAIYPQAQELQLTGCMLTQTLYYVSEGIPVEITQEDGTRRYIVGYDSANIWLYDGNGQSPVRMSLTEAKTMYDTHDSQYRAFLY